MDMPQKTRFEWRHQYDTATEESAGKAAIQINEEPSLTQQHFAEDADLNVIMRRYGVTDGAIPPAVTDPSYFGDFSDVPDFRTAMDRLHNAKEHFSALPANIRNRFGNDMAQLHDFVHNPENFDEAIKLGLLKREDPPVEPKPQKVEIVNQPAPTPPTGK